MKEELTKREYFAGLCMQRLVGKDKYFTPDREGIERMAQIATACADGLIKELEKKE